MTPYEKLENTVGSLTVKDLPKEDQPRERAEKHGCEKLSNADLWALILRTGTPGTPITKLCRDIMKDNNESLHTLERRTLEELRAIKGIGLTKSIQVRAVMELIKRYCHEEIPEEECIASSQQIYKYMRHEIGNRDHEEVWILLLNRRNQIKRRVCLTKGTGVASLFDVKAAMKQAIINNAEGVILCHNHPSGNKLPSTEDDNITRELKKACDMFHLRMLDHLIVTANGYYSYHDNARLI